MNSTVLRYRVCAALLGALMWASTSQAAIVALKRDAGLDSNGPIDPRFADAAVQVVSVMDAGISNAGNGRWYNYGANATAGNTYILYKFDLGSLADLNGATIHLAQVRFYHTTGNTANSAGLLGQVLTHDWQEGIGTGAYPGAAGGVSFAHPIGYNTNYNRNAADGSTAPLQSWGPNSDSFFSTAEDVGPLLSYVSSPVNGAGWLVNDVTAIVQSWVTGAAPNYGFAQIKGNYTFALSEYGTQYQPVLFIDYTPVPEPATCGLLAMAGLTFLARRGRRML